MTTRHFIQLIFQYQRWPWRVFSLCPCSFVKNDIRSIFFFKVPKEVSFASPVSLILQTTNGPLGPIHTRKVGKVGMCFSAHGLFFSVFLHVANRAAYSLEWTFLYVTNPPKNFPALFQVWSMACFAVRQMWKNLIAFRVSLRNNGTSNTF